MPRPAKLWKHAKRPGWWGTVNGRKINFGTDRKEAETAFHRMKAAGPLPKRGSVTVGHLVRLYLEDAMARVKRATYENYAWSLERWLEFADNIVAAELKPFHVTEWLKVQGAPSGTRGTDSYRRGWNSSSKHLAVGCVLTWSKWCDDEGHLEFDPLSRVKRPPIASRSAPPDGFIGRFIKEITVDAFRDFCLVLLDTAARPGEIRSLEARWISWNDPSAIVSGKTGTRAIALSRQAVAILERCAAKFPDGPVLRNSKGDPWSKSAVKAAFRRTSIKAKLQPKLISYSFRHDFWRRASENGGNNLVAMDQLGHADLKMLSSNYAHVRMQQMVAMVEKASVI
jgi:integrase